MCDKPLKRAGESMEEFCERAQPNARIDIARDAMRVLLVPVANNIDFFVWREVVKRAFVIADEFLAEARRGGHSHHEH